MIMTGVSAFEAHRPRLFAVAYLMLGSASEAEDVVQDAWLRYAAADRDDLRSPEAFLTTIVTRLCLDRLKSACVAREQYIGPWLPEPILTDDRSQPDQAASLAESLTLAFMVLLETLSPEERAVCLLREAFEYSYAEIAPMLETTEANAEDVGFWGDGGGKVVACDIAADRIAGIRVVRNPEKLAYIVRQLK